MMAARYFMLRVTRFGPLVPARLVEVAHEPGQPDNPRDRWPPMVLCADIAGEVRPPEEITDRFRWPQGHWKFAESVTETMYRYQLLRLRWAENNRPNDPSLKPRRAVDPAQLPLPDFSRENAI